MHEYKGSLDATEKTFAIVAARFNETYVRRLVDGAVDCLARLGADEDDVTVYWVPGSFEVAGAAQVIAASGNVDAVIGLGCLIRGETSHYDLVAQQAAAGIAEVMTETGVPCIFGIVTAENPEQAEARCGGKMGNRGWDAAQAAVEMANVSEAFALPEYEDLDDDAESFAGEDEMADPEDVKAMTQAELNALLKAKDDPENKA